MQRLVFVLVAIVAVSGVIFFYSFGPFDQRESQLPDPDPASYQALAPLQYASFLRGREQRNEKISKFDKLPALQQLYAGMPFSEDYYTTRNHTYALEDLRAIRRGKPSAFCITCKTSDFIALLAEKGEANLNAASFTAIDGELNHAIGCIDCHNPSDFSLAITRPSLERGLAAIGINLRQATQQDMRTLACAQCHVEYFFRAETSELILPWNNGLSPADIESFFAERGWSDWHHPVAGVDLVKIQHPEYENYQGSIHQRLGVSCSDCHMPRIEAEGQMITSHAWLSPLETVAASCGGCHGPDYDGLIARSRAIQEEVMQGLREAGDLLAQAALALQEAATTRGVSPEQLANPRAPQVGLDSIRKRSRISQCRFSQAATTRD